MTANEQAARAEAAYPILPGGVTDSRAVPSIKRARLAYARGWREAESALLARLSDPDPALVEAACVAFTKSAGDDDWQVLSERERESYRRDLRAALTRAAAHLTDPTPTEDGAA